MPLVSLSAVVLQNHRILGGILNLWTHKNSSAAFVCSLHVSLFLSFKKRSAVKPISLPLQARQKNPSDFTALEISLSHGEV